MSAVRALSKREFVRFVRQPTRIVASVATALLLWLVLAGGLSGAFAGPMEYGPFLVPGMAAMVALFSSIFAAMSLIEDRESGYLQAVVVAPRGLRAMVIAKCGSGAVLAGGQAAVVLVAGPVVGLTPTASGWLLALAALGLLSIGVTGLGLALAWRTSSVAGFHGIMNGLLMPMWLLSGAVFPRESAHPAMGVLMDVNPMSFPIEALRDAMGEPSLNWPWLGAIGFAAGGLALAWVSMTGKARA